MLLLLDEPFSALDAGTRRALRTELLDIKQTLSVPVLHVTHDLNEARLLGDAILPLAEGRIAPHWLDENDYAVPRTETDHEPAAVLCASA